MDLKGKKAMLISSSLRHFLYKKIMKHERTPQKKKAAANSISTHKKRKEQKRARAGGGRKSNPGCVYLCTPGGSAVHLRLVPALAISLPCLFFLSCVCAMPFFSLSLSRLKVLFFIYYPYSLRLFSHLLLDLHESRHFRFFCKFFSVNNNRPHEES
jgi:hypothetical protein